MDTKTIKTILVGGVGAAVGMVFFVPLLNNLKSRVA